MSLDNEGRNLRSISGKRFSGVVENRIGGGRFAQEISSALRRDYGDTHAAVKIIVNLTGTNKRAAKNWLEARNSPNAESLVALCRHSDRVLETVLRLADRESLLKVSAVLEARRKLRETLQVLDRLVDTT